MNNPKQGRQLPSKIGLFGGTFNTMHLGHMQVAQDVLKQFQLDCIHFIPCAMPPHKTAGPITHPVHRLEMVRLAISGQRGFVVSDVEIQRDGPSYTWDTLEHYKSHLAPEAQLFFMVGLDAFLEIHTWKKYLQLFDAVGFIVMSRPGIATTTADMTETVLEYVHTNISPDYQAGDEKNTLHHATKQSICLAAVTPVAIASSQIRKMIAKGESIEPWVTPPVARYIKEKGLFR